MKKSHAHSTVTKANAQVTHEEPVRGLTPSEKMEINRAEAQERAKQRQADAQSQKVPPPQGQYVIAHRDGKKRYMPLEVWLKMTPAERMKFSFERTADPRNHYQLSGSAKGKGSVVRVRRTL